MKPDRGSEQSAPRSRKSSAGDTPATATTTNRPLTFFLTRDPDQSSSSRSKVLRRPEALDVLPVKDLQGGYATQANEAHHDSGSQDGNDSRRRLTITPGTVESRGDATTGGHGSRPPLAIEASSSDQQAVSPAPWPSKTFKSEQITNEDHDEAIMSSDDENGRDIEASVSDSAPQLIMPSIKMPSRRPFTQRGGQLGRLKIMVTGSRGSGRTSLIKSIVQVCEHIVHVDAMSNTGRLSSSTKSSRHRVNEIYASTKSYPEWWSDIDESRILRRRKSLGNSILERNICFVDVTGSGKVEDALAYVEQQLLISVSSINQPGTELKNLLSGRGGCQVDLVLYLITEDTLQLDIDQINKISQIANVVPLIAKADLLSTEQLATIRSSMSTRDCPLPRLPMFAKDNAESSLLAPYLVSSANGPDVDNMDASLLMSPEYVQPLLPSDLATLVDQVFEPSVLEYLRYLSGRKLAAWYASSPKFTKQASPSLGSVHPSHLDSPAPTSLSHSGFLNPVASEVSLNTSNSFALAKVADHTQREEHLAQLRLSKWASELQLSLQRERERYENIAQNERALWLVQKMGEEIRDGQIVPVQPLSASNQTMLGVKRSTTHGTAPGRYEVYDPLGLIRLQDAARARGWVMLQIIGSFGVVGGVAIWLAKTFGWTTSAQEWFQTWNARGHGSDR